MLLIANDFTKMDVAYYNSMEEYKYIIFASFRVVTDVTGYFLKHKRLFCGTFIN